MTTTDRGQVEINLRSEQTIQKLKELQAEAKRVTAEMKKMGADSPERAKAKERLTELTAEAKKLRKELSNRIDVIINDKDAKANFNELTAAARKLHAELKKLPEDAAEFAEKSKRFQEINQRIEHLNHTMRGTGGLFNKIKSELGSFGMMAAGYLGFQFISSQITNITKSNGKLEDSLADIRRVSGLTADEVLRLNTQLGKLDTRTSTAELRELAIIAGKLGVAKDEILGFTQAMDMLVVALGDELGDATTISTELGKIINVFGKTGKITGEELTRVGNAIVDLANKGVASGGFIVDFTQRMAGLAKTANIGLDESIGLAAGLEELGLRSESSSTAVIKMIGAIGSEVPKYAKIANVSVEEFSATLAKRPVEALIQVAAGLTQGKGSFEEIAKAFDAAGEDGARIISVLGVMGGKADFLRGKINDTGVALNENGKITEAYNLKNQTLGAMLDKLGKEFHKLVTSSTVTHFLKLMVHYITVLIHGLRELPSFISRNANAFMVLGTTAAMLSVNMSILTAKILIKNLALLASKVAYEAGFRAMLFAESATKTYAATVQLLSGKLTTAEQKTKAWNAVIGSNPWNFIIGLIVALAGAVALYSRNTAEAIALEYKKVKLSTDIINAGNEIKKVQAGINETLKDFIRLSPEEQKYLVADIRYRREQAKATLEAMLAKKASLEQDASQLTFLQSLKIRAIQTVNPLAGGAETAKASLSNIKDIKEQFSTPLEELTALIKGYDAQVSQAEDITLAFTRAKAINAQTTAQWSEKERLLRTALDNTKQGTAEYKEIALALAEAQSHLSSNTGESSEAMIKQADAVKKVLIEFDALEQKIQKMQANSLELTPEQKEIKAVTDKYKPLIEEAEQGIKQGGPEAASFTAIRAELIDEQLAEINDIRKKYEDQYLQEREEARLKIEEATMDDHALELKRTASFYDELLALARKYGFDIEALETAKAGHLKAILDKQTADEKKDLNSQKNARLKHHIETYRAAMSYGNMMVEMAQGFGEMIGISTQKATALAKAAALTKLGIDTAEAISTLVKASEMTAAQAAPAAGPAAPAVYTATKLGLYLTGAASIFKNIGMARQILSSGNTPTAAMGAVIPGNVSHADGGLDVVDPRTGRKVLNIESGEVLGSKAFAANNPEMVNLMLDAGRNNGRINPQMLVDTIVPVLSQETMDSLHNNTTGYGNTSVGERRGRKYSGGATEGKAGVNFQFDYDDNPSATEGKAGVNRGDTNLGNATFNARTMEQLTTILTKLDAALERGIKADVVLTEMERKQKLLAKARESANIARPRRS